MYCLYIYFFRVSVFHVCSLLSYVVLLGYLAHKRWRTESKEWKLAGTPNHDEHTDMIYSKFILVDGLLV